MRDPKNRPSCRNTAYLTMLIVLYGVIINFQVYEFKLIALKFAPNYYKAVISRVATIKAFHCNLVATIENPCGPTERQ